MNPLKMYISFEGELSPDALENHINTLVKDIRDLVDKEKGLSFSGNELKMSDITRGMQVSDNGGYVGYIEKIVDKHNVLVAFDAGGSSLHCLDPAAESYDQLYSVENENNG